MKILSIDDNKTNLLIIKSYTQTLNIQTTSCTSAIEALKESKKISYDLILVDYLMPEMNGLEFIKELRKLDVDIPIIMLTAVDDDTKLQVEALNLGANDFLNKPLNSASFKARITNMLKLRKSQLLLKNRALLLEEEVQIAVKSLRDRETETLEVLGKSAEFKDPETGAHIIRVANYCKILARLAGLDEKMQNTIYYASPFHDLGKIGISDDILRKPGKLTKDEFDTMKKHTDIGYEILKDTRSAYLKAGGIIAYTHHEKYDGTGYPRGIKAEEIPLTGRITAIADVFDALSSKRPYKEAWTFEASLAFIIEEKNKHFDPVLVDLFVDNISEFRVVYDKLCEV